VIRRLLPRVWLLAAFAQGALCRAALPEPEQFVANVDVGRAVPANHVFDLELWDLTYAERSEWFGRVLREFERVAKTSQCDAVGQRRLAMIDWTAFAISIDSEAAWSAARTLALARAEKLDQAIDAAAANVRTDSSARITELRRRFARDMAVRTAKLNPGWIEDLPEAAADAWNIARRARMHAIQCANSAWLRVQMAEIGWFTIADYGADSDNAAWHLVQHADSEVRFQRATLEFLESLPQGATSRTNLAYLQDRVAVNEGRPQRYGTQGRCTAEGEWRPYEVEAPAQLATKRESLGIEVADPVADVGRSGCLTAPTASELAHMRRPRSGAPP